MDGRRDDVHHEVMLAVAWYRLRASFHDRWATYLTIVLLVGVIGGLAMGAVAGARRSQSAFPDYLASSHASDLQLQIVNPASPFGGLGGPDLTQRLARLPHVLHVASAPGFSVAPLGSDGRPIAAEVAMQNVGFVGSRAGEYFTQDRLPVAAGHRADPNRTDQFMASAEVARLARWHVGQRVSFGAYTVRQIEETNGNFLTVRPAVHFSATLVGLVVFPSQLVRDDVDRFSYNVLMTPALTERLRASSGFPTYALRLEHGGRDVPAVEGEIIHGLSNGSFYNFHLTSVAEGQVERASRPEAIALGVFGLIAGLAALLIAGQVIARVLRADRESMAVLRSLGARRVVVTSDAALGPLGAVVLGALLAVGLAVVFSPFAPLGPAGQVDPRPGVTFDWTVLAAGFLVLAVGLGALTVALAARQVARGPASQTVQSWRRPRIALLASAMGFSEPAVTGLRFALRGGGDRSSVPARSMMLGAVVAVAIVVATVTFGSSLDNLDTHPALYGWNWDYAVAPVGNNGNLPPVTSGLLHRDADVAAWTDYQFANFQLDGQTVPTLVGRTDALLSPPILSGHPLKADDEVVLGAATLARLHKHVGDSVTLTYGSPRNAPIYISPTRLKIVGAATLPTIGNAGNNHTSMGTGAVVSEGIEPARLEKALAQHDPNDNGPAIDVVRLKPAVSPAAGLASLRRVAEAATRVMDADPDSGGGTFHVLAVQRPAEIINYQSSGATPVIVAVILGASAVGALALTLVAGVRNRRRELALLKTLGYTRRQLASAVGWQAAVTAFVGVVIGVPIGIAAGRVLWDLFARSIDAVPQPTVPAVPILLIAAGALLLASIVAVIPARIAARTPAASQLRSE
jgi:hypothetical protein